LHKQPAGTEKKKLAFPPGTWRPLLLFLAASVILVIATPIMVRSSKEIADTTGLGTTFIGTTLVALVTSLPELVTSIFAIHFEAADMAIGELFGSNMFNIFILGFADIFYTQGRFLEVIDPFCIDRTFGTLNDRLGVDRKSGTAGAQNNISLRLTHF